MGYHRCKNNEKDYTLINDDVFTALSKIKSKSIDVIITDPPYYKVVMKSGINNGQQWKIILNGVGSG